MSTQGLAAAVAIVGGIVIAVVLFVPFAAVHYRRHGRLTGGDLVTLVAGAVYGLALWTYTLLPLPADDGFACREPVTRVSELTDAVRSHPHDTLLDLARNPMVLQIALNVALFVPLGALVRIRGRRGVVAALVAGLAVSLMIELTQYTGIWGLYHCAYRYFDIGDLIANPLGSVIGSLAAAIFVSRRPEPPQVTAPRLTTGRRAVALASDVIVVGLVGSVTVVAWRAWMLVANDVAVDDIDTRVQALVQWGVPLALQATLVLGWGRTVGEAVVQVRTRARRRGWTLPGRAVKLTTGVGALAVLGAGILPGSGWLLLALVAAHIAGTFSFSDGRGLSNALAGLDVELTTPDSGSDHR